VYLDYRVLPFGLAAHGLEAVQVHVPPGLTPKPVLDGAAARPRRPGVTLQVSLRYRSGLIRASQEKNER
jgi:hypothetical protein